LERNPFPYTLLGCQDFEAEAASSPLPYHLFSPVSGMALGQNYRERLFQNSGEASKKYDNFAVEVEAKT
jgi:hypothetical protein